MLTALAITILSLVAIFSAYGVVRQSLRGDLQRGLRQDAAKIAARYETDQAGSVGGLESLLYAPTGRVEIQLYDALGSYIISSNEARLSSDIESLTVVPPEVIVKAHRDGVQRDWSGALSGQPVQAALAPWENGVAVVLASTGFISTSLRELAQRLLITALLLISASAILSYAVTTAAMQPITQLANFAARVDPMNLQPFPYEGPRDEIGQLSSVLNDLIMRLKAALDAQRSFLAETSHELRTPLTSLQGFLERASRRADTKVQRDLDDAKRISKTMSRLVADILQLSRGELVQEIVPHLLDPYLDILQPVAEEFPGVNVHGSPGETLVGDPERLRQLVRNLTANAVRAAGSPGAVDLRVSADEHSVTIEVCDRGPGIPEDMLPHIFDKFYKGPGGGAGLGLAIVKQIAAVHEGRLDVNSVVGQGTNIRLVLPLDWDVGETVF